MKLKLTAMALSLAGLALTAAPASAWWLRGNHGINRYSTVIVCRPYNAFTPAVSGSLVCDGFCPFSCPQMPSGASCSPLLGNPLLGMCYDPAAMAGIAQAPPLGHAPNYGHHYAPAYGPAYGPAQAAPVQQFQAPLPMPLPNQQTQMPMPYYVQPATYQPGYYPGYYPMVPAPMSASPYQQAPAYWYGY